MYARLLLPPQGKSFFLFGPRGTGKSTWVKSHYCNALTLDLLNQRLFQDLHKDPGLFGQLIENSHAPVVVIDEVQKMPELLNEVQRFIVEKKTCFILTGSSARKLREKGVNLLAGRARTLHLFPLTSVELGNDLNLSKSLRFGHLPEALTCDDPVDYLKSYIGTYLREEVLQEARIKNLTTFSRFLEAATFSQASILNVQSIASDCGVDRKTAESYFQLLEDFLIGVRIPIFQRKPKRKLISHSKFYYFDVGVYQTLKRKGPLDLPEEAEGIALESLVFQEIRATLSYLKLDHELTYWRTTSGLEVDFVIYGEKIFIAIEVKRSDQIRGNDLKGLQAFLEDYPIAKGLVFYGGSYHLKIGKIEVIPIDQALKKLPELFR